MRQLYVTTGGKYPELLGILSEVKPASNTDPFCSDSEYMFEYTLGSEFPVRGKRTVRILGFEDPKATYVEPSVHRTIISRFTPPENCRPFFKAALEQYGMKKYDEWEWIKIQGDSGYLLNLYETLPEKTIAFQKIPILNKESTVVAEGGALCL
jgi:hypothetical protein